MIRLTKLLATTLAVLFLTACGGSSSDGDNDNNASESSFSGTVIDAVNGAPLNGVTIGTEGGTVSSLDGGRFLLGELILSNAPFIRFALDGYREELLANPTLGDGFPGINPNPTLGSGGSAFDTIALVPDDLAGNGGLVGEITPNVAAFALSLEQAEGLTFRVFRRLGQPGSQLSRNDVDVRVIGPDGVIAMFEVPEMRTGQWTVFRVTNGQIVEITEEPVG